MKKIAGVVLFVAAVWGAWTFWSGKGERAGSKGRIVRLATTTSVVDSGLLAKLLPGYEAAQGVKVEVASVGSGEALARLARGDADVAITHAPEEEKALAMTGQVRRTVVWRNDFILVGPADGAEVVAGAGDAREVMRRIAASGRPFVSRGDDSGTHKKERALWAAAGVEPSRRVVAKAGMAATLERASAEHAFTLADRATFVTHRARLALAVLYQDDAALANEYSVLEKGDRSLSTFLTSEPARRQVGAHGVKEHGEALFTPAAAP